MTENRILAYLLEELPEEEAERFEEECFAAENWPDEINLIEEDLIDDYLRDELTPERRRRFEHNYLTTAARRERVRMAAALLDHVDRVADGAHEAAPQVAEKKTLISRLRDFWKGQDWMPRAAVAFATVAIIAGALWFSVPRPNDNRMRDDASLATLEVSMMSGDRAEGARASTLKLPLQGDALRLILTLPEETVAGAAATTNAYRVQVENTSGEIKFSESAQATAARKVSVVIPAEQLVRGAYAATLYAVQPDGSEQRIAGSYRFNVE
ncbi:MAG TPA: hypothetical protein VGW12_15325 [Pyrinomonadaceae bacterium]|nr:hypothetical protein [Pyrinomonadaceae bacterium]